MNFLLKLISLSTTKSIYQLDELAYLLDINNSTLKNNIKILNTIKPGIYFEPIKGVGYKIVVSDINKAFEFSNKDFGLDFLTTKQRLIFLFSKTNNYLKTSTLCEQLFISRTKLQKEIEIINSEKNMQVKIIYTPYKGYRLCKDELQIRKYLLNNLQIFPNLQLINIKIIEYLEQSEQVNCSREDINNFCKVISLCISRNNYLQNFDYNYNSNLLKFLQLNLTTSENMYISYAYDYYILKKKAVNFQIEYQRNYEALSQIASYYTFEPEALIENLAGTITINDYYNDLIIIDKSNPNFINSLLTLYLQKNNKQININGLDEYIIEQYRNIEANALNKILIIKGRDELDDQLIISQIKDILSTVEIKSTALYKKNEIITYNPDLIVITDIIDGDILSSFIQTRRINLNTTFRNKQINLRHYLLDYKLLQIYRNKVTFLKESFDSTVLIKKKQLSIELTTCPRHIFNINIDTKTITISEMFYMHSLQNLLTAQKVVDLFLNNFLNNKTENELRSFIDLSFKC